MREWRKIVFPSFKFLGENFYKGMENSLTYSFSFLNPLSNHTTENWENLDPGIFFPREWMLCEFRLYPFGLNSSELNLSELN